MQEAELFSSWPPAPRSAWLVGVGGSGMRALAEFLTDLGWTVIGSDSDLTRCQDWASQLAISLVPMDSQPACDVVVRSAAISESTLSDRGVESCTYPEFLARLSTLTPTVAIAGTHGKTTAATMTAAALGNASRIVGGVGVHDGRSGLWREPCDGPIVVEACEYRDHFLQLRPSAACILNTEWDHPDAYRDLSAVEMSFGRFVDQLPADGPCVIDQDVSQRLDFAERKLVTFGADSNANYWPDRVQSRGCGVRFTLMRGDVKATDVSIDCLAPGFVSNAVAAAAMAIELGTPAEKVASGLADYRGVRRRFSVHNIGKTIFVDDYAHHPTAVEKSVRAVAARWPELPAIALFEPHQNARLQAFEAEFADALSGLSEVFIAPVYAAREAEATSGATRGLADRLGSRAVCCDSLDQVSATLETRLSQQPRSVVLLLGAGNIGRILDERLAHNRRQ